MLTQAETRKLAIASRIKSLVFLVFVLSLVSFLAVRFSTTLRGADFPEFYCAARTLVDGHGHQLYDADLQRQFQARYSGRVGTLYNHPPFEALLYLAVAWLPLKKAYLFWCALNLALLALTSHRLSKDAALPWDWRLLLAASLTFIPLQLCLHQGQDSIVLLLLVVLAFTALRREHGFAAGCWLSLGLFKFQIVLPLAFVLILSQPRNGRNELAKGFGLGTLALATISACISGWSVFFVYPMFQLHLHAQPFAGIIPRAMANLRGLSYFFFNTDRSPFGIAAVSILSVALLIKALRIWKQARLASKPGSEARGDEFDLAFAYTIVFALLVSYHLNPHDLSLLLLATPLLLRHAFSPTLPHSVSRLTVALLAILFLPPLHLWALKVNSYALLSLPALALILTASNRHPETSEQTRESAR